MKKLFILISALLPAAFVLSMAASGCDSDSYRYKFMQAEYSTTVGAPLQLHVSRIKMPTANSQETTTDYTDKASSWSVDPADGATVSNEGVFTATKAGRYSVFAYFPNGMFGETVVVVTGPVTAPGTSTQQDGKSRYAAKLSATPCVSSSPDRNRSTQEMDIVFTVSDEDISVDTTSTGGTSTYAGKITPTDGKFTITSENPKSAVQIVGTITDTGVSGVWRLTFSDGDQCTITFQGNRV